MTRSRALHIFGLAIGYGIIAALALATAGLVVGLVAVAWWLL